MDTSQSVRSPSASEPGGTTQSNGYVCLYGARRFECYATTQYQAFQKALEYFKPPKSKRHLVSAHLAEKGRGEVDATTAG
jgi:hypothetical protein